MPDLRTGHPSGLVITRVFNAPRALVFQAWTEADRLARWWGPKGMAIRVHHFDPRPGGVFHYAMVAPEGGEMWGRFEFREIVAPERIIFINSFSDAHGGVTRAPFAPGFPLRTLNIVTLDEQDGKTTLTLRGGPLDATEDEIAFYAGMHASMQMGFGGTFDQLEAFLAHAR